MPSLFVIAAVVLGISVTVTAAESKPTISVASERFLPATPNFTPPPRHFSVYASNVYPHTTTDARPTSLCDHYTVWKPFATFILAPPVYTAPVLTPGNAADQN